MCWSLTASAGFAAVGSVATLAAARAGRPRSHVLMLAYFTAMEALQAAQYLVISDCASVVNQVRRREREFEGRARGPAWGEKEKARAKIGAHAPAT